LAEARRLNLDAIHPKLKPTLFFTNHNSPQRACTYSTSYIKFYKVILILILALPKSICLYASLRKKRDLQTMAHNRLIIMKLKRH
jgi:hypothetical protein